MNTGAQALTALAGNQAAEFRSTAIGLEIAMLWTSSQLLMNSGRSGTPRNFALHLDCVQKARAGTTLAHHLFFETC
jgi:hypothetical protein